MLTSALPFFKTDYFPILLLQTDYFNLTVTLEASPKIQSLNDHSYNYIIILTNKVNAGILGSKEAKHINKLLLLRYQELT